MNAMVIMRNALLDRHGVEHHDELGLVVTEEDRRLDLLV